MAKIATCPRCAKQLGLPGTVAITDQVECPECQAEFMLGETVQISLPVARVINRDHPATAPANSRTSDLLGDGEPAPDGKRSAALTEAAPPRKSWEDRLKKALARDASNEEFASSTDATSSALTAARRTPEVSDIAADASSSSSVEVEFDHHPPADLDRDHTKADRAAPRSDRGDAGTTEPAGRRTETLTKTLADFAAAVEFSPVDSAPPAAQRSAPRNATDSDSVTVEPNVANELSQPVALSDEFGVGAGVAVGVEAEVEAEVEVEVETAVTEQAARVVPGLPRKTRSADRRFPKFAALVAGPVLGSLLGLFGLLWLQGADADYVGLSHVLPASLLPANWSGSNAHATLADLSRPAEILPEAEHAALSAAPQDVLHSLRRSPVPMKRDASVLPASATEGGIPTGPVALKSPARSLATRSLATRSLATTSPATRSTATEFTVAGSLAAGSTARITVGQFHVLVDDAAVALPEFFVGDLSMPESIQSKGQAYVSLCRLAEHFDFSQQPGLAPTAQAKVSQARQLYQSATRGANSRVELAHIASRWWGYPQRPNRGIFLAGQVHDAQPAGSGSLCWVKLSEPSTSEFVPVLLNHQRYRNGDRIGVVGCVDSSPSDALAGFGAGAQRRVASHYDYLLDTVE